MSLFIQLNKEGFTNEIMLAEARKLNIYKNYIVGIMDRNKLDIGNGMLCKCNLYSRQKGRAPHDPFFKKWLNQLKTTL